MKSLVLATILACAPLSVAHAQRNPASEGISVSRSFHVANPDRSTSVSRSVSAARDPDEVSATTTVGHNWDKSVALKVAEACKDEATRDALQKMGIPCPAIAYPGSETETRVDPLGLVRPDASASAEGGFIPRCLYRRDMTDCTPLSLGEAMMELTEDLSLAATGDATAARKMVAEKALQAGCMIPSYREKLGNLCPSR